MTRQIQWCLAHDSLAHRTTGDEWEPEFDYCDRDAMTRGIHRIGSLCEVVDAELALPDEDADEDEGDS